jgi:hypothetical protein
MLTGQRAYLTAVATSAGRVLAVPVAQLRAAAIPDGWFRTGDLAKADADSYFFIVGRAKELIIRAGYNVYPREIEEVLHEHQAVAEVAVIGIPHAELGEEVGAAVKLKPGATAIPAELRVRPGTGGGLQVPAPCLARARAAQGRHWQDPPPRSAAAARPPPVTANATRPALPARATDAPAAAPCRDCLVAMEASRTGATMTAIPGPPPEAGGPLTKGTRPSCGPEPSDERGG